MAEKGTVSSFAVKEIRGWWLVQVAGWRGSTAAIEQDIARACAITPPAEVGGVATAGAITLIRVGPDRVWMVDGVGEVAAHMADAIDPTQGCITPLGEGRRRFRLSGKRVPDVLKSLVALDLAAPSFAPGRAALTMMHRVPVLLHRVADAAFDLYVPTTFSTSLEEWISEAAA
jgi:methylglutamate dehydrogenase subunit D